MRIRHLLAAPLAPASAVLGNPGLRRLELALAATAVATPAYAVALSVYANKHGGATAVGLVWVVILLPAGVLAPFAAALADRGRRERFLALALATRGIALTLTTVGLITGLPPAFVYVLAAVASIASRVVFPAHVALLPSLARTSHELAAANALGSTLESAGGILGPAVAGGLLLVTGPEAIVALAGAAALAAAALVSRLRCDAGAESQPSGLGAFPARELAGGFVAVAHSAALRLTVGVFAAQCLLFGAVNVLLVVLATDLLALGDAGVGLVETAIGTGGVAGGILTLALASGERLGARLRLGTLVWGTPLILIGLWPHAGAVAALLLAVGIGNVMVDVAAFTLIQRGSPAQVRARVFGLLEGLGVGATAAGAGLAPVLIASLGPQGAFAAVGACLPCLALFGWRRLGRLDHGPDREPAHDPVPARRRCVHQADSSPSA